MLDEQQVAAVNAQLRKLLEALSGKPVVSKALQFVVEETLAGHPVKEGTLYHYVYGRSLPAGENKPANVRGLAGSLREALMHYYVHEGRFDHLLIEVEKGGYTPTFTFRSDPPEYTAKSEPPTQPIKTDTLPLPPVQQHLQRPIQRRRRILSFEADDTDHQVFSQILTQAGAALSQATSEITVTICYRVGSLLLEFECSDAGYTKLLEALATGELTNLAGSRITALHTAEHLYGVLRQQESPVLEVCFTPTLDFSQCDSTSIRLILGRGLAFNSTTSDAYYHTDKSVIQHTIPLHAGRSLPPSILLETRIFLSPDGTQWPRLPDRINTTNHPDADKPRPQWMENRLLHLIPLRIPGLFDYSYPFVRMEFRILNIRTKRYYRPLFLEDIRIPKTKLQHPELVLTSFFSDTPLITADQTDDASFSQTIITSESFVKQ